ncbi:MAG: type IV toxin-antitoxin system AbiEi family antitoxin domain-containing protein [Thermoleophilaceae bacterium]
MGVIAQVGPLPSDTPLWLPGLCGAVRASAPGDAAVAAVAATQRGAISYAQLRAAGLGRGAIANRVANGRLHRLHRGVYLVGHPAPAPLAREVAAVLACGPGAVLSHRSAAALWRLLPGEGRDVDVTVMGRRRGRHAGVRVHRPRHLDESATCLRDLIPATTAARTLLDLAEVVDEHRLERAINEAFVLRLTTERKLRELLGVSPGRRGTRTLREALDRAAGPSLTRSEAEARLLELLHAGRLPSPETNVTVGGYEVDVLWRDERLVLEVDGYAFHGTRAAFERDRERDARLQALGFRVVRVTCGRSSTSPRPSSSASPSCCRRGEGAADGPRRGWPT